MALYDYSEPMIPPIQRVIRAGQYTAFVADCLTSKITRITGD